MELISHLKPRLYIFSPNILTASFPNLGQRGVWGLRFPIQVIAPSSSPPPMAGAMGERSGTKEHEVALISLFQEF